MQFPHSSQPVGMPANDTTSNQALTIGAATPASMLAQMADRAAQEHGLLSEARQKLYQFVLQCSPSMDSVWTYAAALRSTSSAENAITMIAALNTKLDVVTNLVRQDFHLSHAQESMIKKLQRRYVATAKIAYNNIPDRTKKYIKAHPSQFSLDLYNSDSTVKAVVDKMVQSDSYQCRGTFRKAIFAEVEGGRVIADASDRICRMLVAGVESPPPKYIQAHIAQLRLIAYERMNLIRQAKEFAAAQAANDVTNVALIRHARGDTLFWGTVDARFKQLVSQNTAVYDGNVAWADWEDEVLSADAALFTGVAEFPDDAGQEFIGDD